jgi:hypothetical protein
MKAMELGGATTTRRIKDMQAEVQKSSGKLREAKIRELDGVVAGGW